jgi:dTDP-4-amino-4,6-dideoxygalactose transaminase
MKTDKFYPYARQTIDESDIQAVCQALRSELITRGPNVARFEQMIADYCGAKWAVAMTNASSALYGAACAAGVSAADRVITTPNSFIATVAAGMFLGAKPVFVDIDRKSGNMSLDAFERIYKEFGAPTRGKIVVMPVHFAGVAMDMRRLDRILSEPNAVIIEDAAHAIGSLYPDGTKVGSCSWSQMTVFSFHAIKTITTAEGGCVTTNDETLYKKLLSFRNNGLQKSSHDPWYYEVTELTGNYYMNEMQAALGISQLEKIDTFIRKRREIVRWYRSHLQGQDVLLFDEAADDRTSYHLFPVQIDFEKRKLTRTEAMKRLLEHGIGSQYHYIPLYRHPVVSSRIGDVHEQFPEMEAYYKQALSLPLYPALEETDVAFICKTLKKEVLHRS